MYLGHCSEPRSMTTALCPSFLMGPSATIQSLGLYQHQIQTLMTVGSDSRKRHRKNARKRRWLRDPQRYSDTSSNTQESHSRVWRLHVMSSCADSMHSPLGVSYGGTARPSLSIKHTQPLSTGS